MSRRLLVRNVIYQWFELLYARRDVRILVSVQIRQFSVPKGCSLSTPFFTFSGVFRGDGVFNHRPSNDLFTQRVSKDSVCLDSRRRFSKATLQENSFTFFSPSGYSTSRPYNVVVYFSCYCWMMRNFTLFRLTRRPACPRYPNCCDFRTLDL